jgi:hypothetical protein
MILHHPASLSKVITTFHTPTGSLRSITNEAYYFVKAKGILLIQLLRMTSHLDILKEIFEVAMERDGNSLAQDYS